MDPQTNFKNLAEATLSESITDSGTRLHLNIGEYDLPTPPFRGFIEGVPVGEVTRKYEYVYVVSRNESEVVVVRAAEEPSMAYAWPAGAKLRHGITAATMVDLYDSIPDGIVVEEEYELHVNTTPIVNAPESGSEDYPYKDRDDLLEDMSSRCVKVAHVHITGGGSLDLGSLPLHSIANELHVHGVGYDMHVDSVSELPTERANSTAYEEGDQVYVLGEPYYLLCTVAGTSGSSAPTLGFTPDSLGEEVIDGTVTWEVVPNYTAKFTLSTDSVDGFPDISKLGLLCIRPDGYSDPEAVSSSDTAYMAYGVHKVMSYQGYGSVKGVIASIDTIQPPYTDSDWAFMLGVNGTLYAISVSDKVVAKRGFSNSEWEWAASLPGNAVCLCGAQDPDYAYTYVLTGEGVAYVSTNNCYSWEEVTIPVGDWSVAVVHNSLLIAFDKTTNSVLTTEGGSGVWSVATMPGTATGWQAAYSDGTQVVAIQSGVSSQAARSLDGVTWSNVTMPSSREWTALHGTDSGFCAVAVGGVSAVSPTGALWTEYSDLPSLLVCYSMGYADGVLVALDGTGDVGGAIYTSLDDGVTWSESIHYASSVHLTPLVHAGNRLVGVTTNSGRPDLVIGDTPYTSVDAMLELGGSPEIGRQVPSDFDSDGYDILATLYTSALTGIPPKVSVYSDIPIYGATFDGSTTYSQVDYMVHCGLRNGANVNAGMVTGDCFVESDSRLECAMFVPGAKVDESGYGPVLASYTGSSVELMHSTATLSCWDCSSPEGYASLVSANGGSISVADGVLLGPVAASGGVIKLNGVEFRGVGSKMALTANAGAYCEVTGTMVFTDSPNHYSPALDTVGNGNSYISSTAYGEVPSRPTPPILGEALPPPPQG